MLLVSSSVGMLDRVHCHTTDLGPAVTLGLVLVVRASGLECREELGKGNVDVYLSVHRSHTLSMGFSVRPPPAT